MMQMLAAAAAALTLLPVGAAPIPGAAPTTAASATFGCDTRADSTSVVEIR